MTPSSQGTTTSLGIPSSKTAVQLLPLFPMAYQGLTQSPRNTPSAVHMALRTTTRSIMRARPLPGALEALALPG